MQKKPQNLKGNRGQNFYELSDKVWKFHLGILTKCGILLRYQWHHRFFGTWGEQLHWSPLK